MGLASSFFKELPTNLLRTMKRKTRRFNVIPRAEKEIDKIQENPMRAPTHETTQKLIDKLIKEHPEKLNELSDKDENLHKNLDSIHVKSKGDNPDIFSKTRLPDSYEYNLIRTHTADENVPEGRYNTTRAEHFLAAHARDPNVYSADALADVYKIDKDAMKNILEYVKVYTVVLPVKKIGEPGILQQMAQDAMPGGLYEEPEIRVVERKLQLARNMMAKIHKQRAEESKTLTYDMSLFESLVAMKPLVKKFKEGAMEEMTGTKTVRELGEKITKSFVHEPESKGDTADEPETTGDGLLSKKAKKKLENIGLLDSRENEKEEIAANRLTIQLGDDYLNPNETVYEETVTPESADEDFFTQQTKKRLENIYLLDDKKVDPKKNNFNSELSSDSAEVENKKSDDVKTKNREKMSDKA